MQSRARYHPINPRWWEALPTSHCSSRLTGSIYNFDNEKGYLRRFEEGRDSCPSIFCRSFVFNYLGGVGSFRSLALFLRSMKSIRRRLWRPFIKTENGDANPLSSFVFNRIMASFCRMALSSNVTSGGKLAVRTPIRLRLLLLPS